MVVFVLTAKMAKDAGGEWRPIAVVDDQHTADEWVKANRKVNDWISFQVNDLSMTDMAQGARTQFKPRTKEENTSLEGETLRRSYDQLVSVIEQLAKRYNDKDVLKLLKTMNLRAVTSAKIAELQDWGEDTLLAEGFEGDALEEETDRRWRMSHAPGCEIRQDLKSRVCTCKHDTVRVPGQPGRVWGCKDCGAMWDKRHEPDCPRMSQQNLFARKKTGIRYLPGHAPSCPRKKEHDDPCNCLLDRMGKSLQCPDGHLGCRDCEGDEGQGHYGDCPRMRQQNLFASELLRKR
jgi:hypothetical protein